MLQPWLKVVVLTAIWCLIILYFELMRQFSVEDIPGIVRTRPFDWMLACSAAAVGGLAIGIPYGVSDLLFDATGLRRRPYWVILLVKGSVQFLITAAAGAAMAAVGTLILQPGDTVVHRAHTMALSGTALMLLVTSLVVSFGINFFQLMQAMIGPRVLRNLLLGRYHQPREEERVFMFLDMRASTSHAERLGNVRYSSLVQDCFSDLTETIRAHQVEVYQYVGDEAVLTWPLRAGLAHQNCVSAYFHFVGTLHTRSDHYRQRYGFVPGFKAGISLGTVTVAEVGIIKREIAYHGDVLNTAARIQAQCNALGQPFLISEDVARHLGPTAAFALELVGELALRGKSRPVRLYGVASG